MRLILFTLFFVSQGVLADGYKKFYEANPATPAEVTAKYRLAPAPKTPELARFRDSFDAILGAYARKGYMAIGASNFTSGWKAKDAGAIKQGRAVGADLVVVIDPELVETVTSSIPLTLPTTQTTYHTGQATAYGSGGSVSAYGSGTSTTHGTQTTHIPYTVNRFQYGAIFFVKAKTITGIRSRPTNDEERRQLQTNVGRVVLVVIDDSPAFLADVLPGDILLRVNGAPVSGDESFFALIESLQGQSVDLVFNRNGTELTKQITFKSL